MRPTASICQAIVRAASNTENPLYKQAAPVLIHGCVVIAHRHGLGSNVTRAQARSLAGYYLASAGLTRTTRGRGTTPGPSASRSGVTSAARIVRQIALKPPQGGPAAGIAEIVRSGATETLAILAQQLHQNTKSSAYAVWLFNSPADSHLLGFVSPPVTSNGRLRTEGALPPNAAHFRNVIVTLETQASPTAPGTIVLEGPLNPTTTAARRCSSYLLVAGTGCAADLPLVKSWASTAACLVADQYPDPTHSTCHVGGYECKAALGYPPGQTQGQQAAVVSCTGDSGTVKFIDRP
jgi:hypothetical protein